MNAEAGGFLRQLQPNAVFVSLIIRAIQGTGDYPENHAESAQAQGDTRRQTERAVEPSHGFSDEAHPSGGDHHPQCQGNHATQHEPTRLLGDHDGHNPAIRPDKE